jgi:hypothetical protein
MSRTTGSLIVALLALTGMSTLVRADDVPTGQSRWPVQVDTSVGQVTVFQPQLENFEGDELDARAAVSVQSSDSTQPPIYGAVWLTSRVSTDRVARTVQILDVTITKTRFPNADKGTQAALTDAIKQVFTGHNVTLSLDQLLAMLETVQKAQANQVDLETTPPKIIFLEKPAVKVQYDGPPHWAPVDSSPLQQADNTPFFVVRDPQSQTVYLKGAGRWFTAPDAMGPFTLASQVPQAVSDLATADGYKDPQQPVSDDDAANLVIVTATDPTEVIWTDGEPELATIPGTDLLYMSNTESDVFQSTDTQQLFVLLSGRWYSAADRNGPWTYVPPDQLPVDFARIPPDSPKADVLADVPGTQANEDAVADNSVPQTAEVDRVQFDQPPVVYDGDPVFQAIPGTDMSYAVNTDASVILCDDQQYYCCYNGVWYTSPNVTGPWSICVKVPREIYTIPPSCPLYPVTYCYVYGSTDDDVYVGYLPGYVGCYDYDGCVVYGTGYYYKPWRGHRYFSRPHTFGFSARYNLYTGHWGFDFAAKFGGGGTWIGHPLKPMIRGGNWFGYGGYRPVAARDRMHLQNAINNAAIDRPQRDVYFRNVYDHRSDVHREPLVGEKPAEHEIVNTIPLHQGPNANARPVANPQPLRNDVFADRDGNVYRKTIDGWQMRDNNQWKPAPERAIEPERPGGVEPARGEPLRPTPPEQHGPEPTHESPQVGLLPERPDSYERQVLPERNYAPQREEPAQGRFTDLNRDYQARVSGEQRSENYQPPAEPAPQPERSAPAPEERGGGGGGGGGGETRGGGGGGGRGR